MTIELKHASRVPVVDLVKALAAQVIVWHHLVLYGPMARACRPWFEQLFDWLIRDGRAAVYAFLVVGGYLAAGKLLPRPGRPVVIAGAGDFLTLVIGRYRRLAPAYLVALVVAILAAALARHWMADADTPLAPGAGQLVAHVLLLQDLLGYPALSAGIWYVAIEIQLYLLLAAIAWVAHAAGRSRREAAGSGDLGRSGAGSPKRCCSPKR